MHGDLSLGTDVLIVGCIQNRRGVGRGIGHEVAVQRVDRPATRGEEVNHCLIGFRDGWSVRARDSTIDWTPAILPAREGMVKAQIVTEFMGYEGAIAQIQVAVRSVGDLVGQRA